jgi:hypothetical protein
MKLDLILENVRNKYNMGLLEESSLTELDVLKGKVLINESTMSIRKMLVEEGTMENVKAFLEESWSYELYLETEHGNDSSLDKLNPLNNDKRNKLADAIHKDRSQYQLLKGYGNKAEGYDNDARTKSQTGNINATFKDSKEFKDTAPLGLKVLGNSKKFTGLSKQVKSGNTSTSSITNQFKK